MSAYEKRCADCCHGLRHGEIKTWQGTGTRYQQVWCDLHEAVTTLTPACRDYTPKVKAEVKTLEQKELF